MSIVLGFLVALFVVWMGWGPLFAQTPPPPCSEQLNNEMFQAGMLKQQLAVARAQLDAMTKERDEAKAAAAKTAPPEPAKK